MTPRDRRAPAARRVALLPLALMLPLALGVVGLAACEGVTEREPEEVGVEQGAAALDEPGAGVETADEVGTVPP